MQCDDVKAGVKAMLRAKCMVLQSLYHSYDLLVRHGMRALYRHINGLFLARIVSGECLQSA